jgi:ribosome biogenesis GTPase
MAQRKLTKHQKRRVSDKRSKQTVESKSQTDSSLLGAEQEGLVITSFGKRVLVENNKGEEFNCAIRQHLGKLVAGDKVIWQTDIEPNTGVVVSLLPRKHELSRPGFRGQTRMVAANIDFIGIVTPVVPGIHPDMIDRYLVAAKQLDIPAVIVLNKIDLLEGEEDWNAVAELLEPYDAMGIEIIPASSVSQEGLEDLIRFMDKRNSVLVGPSGAGKSSLINALIPDLGIRVGALSEATGLGKHTTTNSILYHLPSPENRTLSGGNLIDSPGVRQFSPNPCELSELESCYPDFADYIGKCKFNNCTHQHEPQCAILAAVEDDEIALSRYQSFQRLRSEFADMKNELS